MRLSRLEIYGFKSFARRTEIVFPQNVTGIVGPNGSGKSNIGDAVRWVLGEQSAKMLRGNSMADVIFNGTEKRKPLNYCEVTLVFDNTDHQLKAPVDEVSITRRVYRSGDSEYLMNGSNCRLKDIVDLFRDTGVGKEGYSIIGQGRIDDILSQRSEDRRAIFEEAAGIVKSRPARRTPTKSSSAPWKPWTGWRTSSRSWSASSPPGKAGGDRPGIPRTVQGTAGAGPEPVPAAP